jgi:hypothetical protein
MDITHRGSRENTTQVTLKTLENQGFQDLAVFADFSKNRHFLVSGPKSKRASGQRKYINRRSSEKMADF